MIVSFTVVLFHEKNMGLGSEVVYLAFKKKKSITNRFIRSCGAHRRWITKSPDNEHDWSSDQLKAWTVLSLFWKLFTLSSFLFNLE